MVAQPDADVAAALRAGDETEFATVVRAWSPALLRTAMALTGDRATAESAVRATWMRLPAALDDYRPPPRLRAWVYGMLLDHLGLQVEATDGAAGGPTTVSRSRFLPPAHPQWPGHWEIPPPAWPDMANAPPASHGVEAVLRNALEQLPTAQRVVIALRDVADCEVAEITVMVGQPAEHVRELLHRARAQLRHRLELQLAGTQPA